MSFILVIALLLVVALGVLAYANMRLARELRGAIDSLHKHQAAMDTMAEDLTALRKQIKALLRHANRALSTTDRIIDKQYRQQKDVDDILYWAKERRGELNG